MHVTAWCNRIVRWGFYLLLILVPLILTPWNYELFEYNKMMVTYGLTVIILGAWAVKMLTQKEIKIAKTPLDIPIALFVLSQFVSALFSMDPHISWYGYYSRFNGGMWSVLAYVSLFYAFTSNQDAFSNKPSQLLESRIKNHESGKKQKSEFTIHYSLFTILKVMLGTALVVALYGIAEHMGIDKHLWVQDVQSRVFSTLGQPNWLGAYLVALIPIPFAFIMKRKLFSWQSILYLLLSTIFFLTLLFTRSRSGLLAFAVVDVIFWGMLFITKKLSVKALRLPFFLLHVTFFIIVFFNGVYIDQIDSVFTFNGWKNRLTHTTPVPVSEKPAGTSLETGGTESGTIRKYVWEGAIRAWRATPKNMLIGTGTETFAFAFYQYRPAGHNMTSEWDFLYNKAHNEYLNYLATTGAFGLGSYLLFIGVFIGWFLKMLNAELRMPNKKDSEFSIQHSAFNIALFAGWISILITNFFGFSVVIMQLFLFLFPAFIIVGSKPLDSRTFKIHKYHPFGDILAWIIVGACVVDLIILGLTWQGDKLFALGYRTSHAGQFAQAEPLQRQALALNNNEPVYHDEFASTLGSLAIAALDQKNATIAAELIKQSIHENVIALAYSPKNVNFWKTRTKLYYSFSAYDPALNKAAITALETAQALSPNDPKILYNLAILYGRDGMSEKAITLLEQAKQLKPNYRDTYFALYVFYVELNKPVEGRTQLQYYLDHVDPNDADFQNRLAP